MLFVVRWPSRVVCCCRVLFGFGMLLLSVVRCGCSSLFDVCCWLSVVCYLLVVGAVC